MPFALLTAVNNAATQPLARAVFRDMAIYHVPAGLLHHRRHRPLVAWGGAIDAASALTATALAAKVVDTFARSSSGHMNKALGKSLALYGLLASGLHASFLARELYREHHPLSATERYAHGMIQSSYDKKTRKHIETPLWKTRAKQLKADLFKTLSLAALSLASGISLAKTRVRLPEILYKLALPQGKLSALAPIKYTSVASAAVIGLPAITHFIKARHADERPLIVKDTAQQLVGAFSSLVLAPAVAHAALKQSGLLSKPLAGLSSAFWREYAATGAGIASHLALSKLQQLQQQRDWQKAIDTLRAREERGTHAKN